MRSNTIASTRNRVRLFIGAVAALSALFASHAAEPARASDTPPITTGQRGIAKPDLIVSDVLPYYEYVYPTGWVLVKSKLNVQVYNNGNGDAKAFTVLCQWDMGYSYQQDWFSLIGLKAGQSQWLVVDSRMINPYTGKTVSYDFSVPTAKYEVIVDLGNAINEWDETNNIYSHGP